METREAAERFVRVRERAWAVHDVDAWFSAPVVGQDGFAVAEFPVPGAPLTAERTAIRLRAVCG
ncbi:hypothetical protein GCM10022403_004610 [Streptomyces coacervatus]|uniref:Uncharacterized protein n=1 Tax=Streptomyces coacervatus TaxID=647381 RepID=A0ABP7GPI6_9ACTN